MAARPWPTAASQNSEASLAEAHFDRREIAVVCLPPPRDRKLPAKLRSRTDRCPTSKPRRLISTRSTAWPSRTAPGPSSPQQPGTQESRYTHLSPAKLPMSDAGESVKLWRGRPAPATGGANSTSDRLPTLKKTSPSPSGTLRVQRSWARLPRTIRVTIIGQPPLAVPVERTRCTSNAV